MDVKKLLLLVLLWTGVAVSTLVDLQKRIIGGRDCGPTERLYHVEVRAYTTFPGQDFSKCGGSLISNRWILTAEHCWNAARTMRVHVGIHPGTQETIEQATPYIYRDPARRIHDILLLQLANPTTIHPVPLPNCANPPAVGDTVEIAGFASITMGPDNERNNDRAAALQCATTTVINCTELRNCLQRNNPQFHAEAHYEHWLCFRRDGVDISPGDSGGGVVFNGMIYGVISFSGNTTHACVAPGGAMDVCHYTDWIYRTTSIPRP